MADLRPDGEPLCALRVACLGGGYHSAVGRTHNVALRMDHRFEVVAGCFSTRAEENAFSAARYGVPTERTHASLDALLDREADALDAVVILTPTDQHAEQVAVCLRRGLPVICEKALAVTSHEIAEMERQIAATRGYLAVTFNYLGYPMLRELREIILAGELGDLEQVHIEMPQEGFLKLDAAGRPMTPQSWRLRDHDVPTLSLDLGVHVHSIVRFLTGEHPVSAVAMTSTLGNFPEVVDNAMCLAHYSGGVDCSIWFSKVALGHRNGLRVRIYGARGSAEWVQEQPELLSMAFNNGMRQIVDRASPGIRVATLERYQRFKAGHPAGFIEAFANYYSDVADSLAEFLRTGATPDNPLVYGAPVAREGTQLMEAISRSTRQRAWIDL